ncbi:MAG TPA: NAD(P)H-hydrate dehydratase [Allosphingosinicella sp.]
MNERFILTAEEMRAAEARSIAAGTPVEALMERAGLAAAEAVLRYVGPMPALILCGPGNNGGDGYVVARSLRERGAEVRVAALGEPTTKAARAARARWDGPVAPLEQAEPAPLLVDALFGTGLRRALAPEAAERLAAMAAAARLRVAIDLPSGAATDDGSLLSPVPDFDLTIGFQTHKPSHLLQPAARHMGKIILADIGIEAASRLVVLSRPRLRAAGPDDHKYRRGYVAVVAGEMPGAAALAAAAALRAGAGYVRLVSDAPVARVPNAVVQGDGAGLEDNRIGALAIGPGLGRGEAAAKRLRWARAAGPPLILDADALFALHLDPTALDGAILTPHEGEFRRLFGALPGSKIERARCAARMSGAVIVYKGADTVIAAPDGRAAISAPSPWLASAGTGDVLAGIVAAVRAAGLEPFEAACAGAWLHGRAAVLAGPGLIAEDLLETLPAAFCECL